MLNLKDSTIIMFVSTSLLSLTEPLDNYANCVVVKSRMNCKPK